MRDESAPKRARNLCATRRAAEAASRTAASSGVRVMNREREIVKASIYGIIGNALLVAFKMAVGFMSHSIAIILDGVNNATDALSSIVTIVQAMGTQKMAREQAIIKI